MASPVPPGGPQLPTPQPRPISDQDANVMGLVALQQRNPAMGNIRANRPVAAPGANPAVDQDQAAAQFGQAQIQDFDYGRLRETNPLAYLGYLNGGTKTISEYQTPSSALGVTFKGPPDKQSDDYDYTVQLLQEAGVDPKSAAGHIILGPEFAAGQNTNTMEHELMHRGLNYLAQKDPAFAKKYSDIMDYQHSIIHSFQDLYGFDRHSHNLEAGDELRDPKLKYSEDRIKEIAGVLKDEVDAIQQHARQHYAR